MKPSKISKHPKYKTKNLISKFLVNKFYNCIYSIVNKIKIESVIDLGCGEGHLLNFLSPHLQNKYCAAIDFDENEVKDAKNNLLNCDVTKASIYNVPYPDRSFDLVICTEVLEHLDSPDVAISEIKRLSKKYVILSVPREPLWRSLNMLRLSYLNSFGNTPGHINHWSARSFKKIIKQNFNIISVYTPIPWTIILAEQK